MKINVKGLIIIALVIIVIMVGFFYYFQKTNSDSNTITNTISTEEATEDNDEVATFTESFRSLTSAEGLELPETVNGTLNLRSLTSAEGLVLPRVINGHLFLNSLTSAEGLELPETVNGTLNLDGLISVEGLVLPNIIEGNLSLARINTTEGLVFLTTIKGAVNFQSLSMEEKQEIKNKYPKIIIKGIDDDSLILDNRYTVTIDIEEGTDAVSLGNFNDPPNVIDEDNDLLPLEFEKLWQSSDNNIDSDNDGYSDKDEILGCYKPNGTGIMDGDYFSKSFCPAWWKFALTYAEADTITYNKYVSLIPEFCSPWSSFSEYFVSSVQSTIQKGERMSYQILDSDGKDYKQSCSAMINNSELVEFMEYIVDINVEPSGNKDAEEIFCEIMADSVKGMCGEWAMY